MREAARPADVIDADYVKVRLEEAGACLLALPSRGTLPAGYRTAWPEIVRAVEAWFSAVADGPQRPPAPSPRKISEMDEVYFTWLPLVSPGAVQTRQLLWLRSLVNPVNDKHLWPWRRLQDRLGLNRETLARYHSNGIDRIVTKLNNPDWKSSMGSELP
ncbi:DUF6362 family protein [Rhodopila globiformis]|uniref:DUF6362 domain-containing protein n=1 Tax=Rhodopila globiformis TaxID=1071 RepID=A0A2S6N7J1_RHOGL|nr:DUF6362 family protein [Rhodopila globiformis]PPQ30578.1 hypothetical protein CCS01_18880 [Rhodopila globiformis]